MKTVNIALLAALALVAGCLTREELIARRIAEKQSFFAALPPEQQERIRKGELRPGDSQEAAWIIFGEPDRRFTKVDGTSTNEVWSYSDYEFERFDHPRPVAHPVRGPGGRMFWQTDYIWCGDSTYNVYEYMRIEFANNRVKGYEEEDRSSDE